MLDRKVKDGVRGLLAAIGGLHEAFCTFVTLNGCQKDVVLHQQGSSVSWQISLCCF